MNQHQAAQKYAAAKSHLKAVATEANRILAQLETATSEYEAARQNMRTFTGSGMTNTGDVVKFIDKKIVLTDF